MFYPYLRGKQHELAAIRCTAQTIARSAKITPIIEPVTANLKPLHKASSEVLEAGASIALITNPQVGALASRNDVLDTPALSGLLDNYESVLPTLLVHSSTSVVQARAFLGKYDRPVVFVHKSASVHGNQIADLANGHGHQVSHLFRTASHTYRALFTGLAKALLNDHFTRCAKNADYPDDEFYSDAHQTYTGHGYHGFGDYSIVGDQFKESGGPAHAVALHLHYQRPDGNLWVRHFVSDDTETTADTPGKFLQAVRKLEHYVNRNPAVGNTDGCREYLQYARDAHFPGLGVAKQLSIRHHLELMAQILSPPRSGRTPTRRAS